MLAVLTEDTSQQSTERPQIGDSRHFGSEGRLCVDDLQARRLCAAENIQRADLTSLEEVMALAELVDATLLEFSDEYETISDISFLDLKEETKKDKPKWRVRALLTKLESDRKHGTDYFGSKFTAKIAEIFSGLPKPKDPISFTTNDLPLLFTANDVQQFSLEHRLNKSTFGAKDRGSVLRLKPMFRLNYHSDRIIR